MAHTFSLCVKTPLPASAFISTAEAHPFQPQVKTLPSPSIDAKQQLQRKIQKKQQEQKLHSPLLGEAQARRAGGGTPSTSSLSCGSPALLSPQPTIGIVVSAVPSPITVQRNRQLMSPSPVSTGEGKVNLPVNFQVVAQNIQPLKQNPKTPQNVPASPVGDRSARQRYAQILPKPSSANALTLRSPPTLLITNSPINTVMPTPHVSSVNVVKMTTISLAPNSSTTTTTFTNTTLRPASTGLSCIGAAEEIKASLKMRSGSAAPILSPIARPGWSTSTFTTDVKKEAESIRGSELGTSRLNGSLEADVGQRAKGAMPRAASVPTPQTKGSLGLQALAGTKCNEKLPSGASTLAAPSESNIDTSNEITLNVSVSNPNSNAALSLGGAKEAALPRVGFLNSKSPRKRSVLSPESHPSPVKRVFISQQPVGGCYFIKQGIGAAVKKLPRPGATVRPESAPASAIGRGTVKGNSTAPTRIVALFDSAAGNSCFQTVDPQSSMQRKGTPAAMDTSSSTNVSASVNHAVVQQQHQQHIIDNSGLPEHSNMSDLGHSMWTGDQLQVGQREGYPQQMDQANHKQVSSPVLNPMVGIGQAQASSQLSLQTDVDYFSFHDDDMTQDSIVEELVQMEEQMKLNNSLQAFGGCADVQLQSHQAVVQSGMMSSNQTANPYYHSAYSSSTPIHTPTPTPTPTPTSEIMGGGQGLSSESPCPRLAPTTPVDSALGSSRLTPIGTPHSNCSGSVPPSPVECRNPFAFTPINSNITSFQDNMVSSSPVKPMQRPMATHPDKAKLDWMNNGYNSSSGGNSNSGISILPNYQGLVDDRFRKPHAFAIPGQSYHSQTQRHHENHFGRLTPISPVQQQVCNMANLAKQEGFAVPAPLDSKTTSSAANFRCRSVSPAVRQRNLSGNTTNAGLPNIPRTVVSPFSCPVTPEVLNIFANSRPDGDVSMSMVQRSQSVPLNVMMQNEVMPMPGQQSNTKKITNMLLSKMEGDSDDAVRGLGINNLASSYMARMNLTQILETDPTFSGSANHQTLITSSHTTNAYNFQKPGYLMKNTRNEQMILSARDSQAQSTPGEQQQLRGQQQQQQNQHDQAMLLAQNPPQQQQHLHQQQQHQHQQQQQQLDFSTTVKELLANDSLTTSNQLVAQVSDLNSGGSEFQNEITSSINDLNTLDTNLLFDPNQQQGQYEDATPEELMNDPLFQQICSETANANGFDWLESKDQPTVGLMG
ncbi:DNA-binding protein RFX7-like [Aplochiton taeniatus]